MIDDFDDVHDALLIVKVLKLVGKYDFEDKQGVVIFEQDILKIVQDV